MKRHYEDAPEYDADAYFVKGHKGIAWYVLGWEIEKGTEEVWIDDETAENGEGFYSWDEYERRTGKLVLVMVGDDRHFAYDPEDIEPLAREEYCGECGQIGCCHDGYDREGNES